MYFSRIHSTTCASGIAGKIAENAAARQDQCRYFIVERALIDEDGQERVVPQLVVIVEVFVAQAQPEDALLEEFGERVLDQVGVAVIGEAAGELFDEVEAAFDLAEEQAAGVGGHVATVKAGDDGRLIGRGGRTINALRTILKAMNRSPRLLSVRISTCP